MDTTSPSFEQKELIENFLKDKNDQDINLNIMLVEMFPESFQADFEVIPKDPKFDRFKFIIIFSEVWKPMVHDLSVEKKTNLLESL